VNIGHKSSLLTNHRCSDDGNNLAYQWRHHDVVFFHAAISLHFV